MRENERFSTANPFRVPPQVLVSWRKRAFYSALKVCLVAVCALTVTIVLATQSRRWLLYQLTNDFASLPTEAQALRLDEIAELDDLGISFLVQNLVAEDANVARRAYELLGESQSRWAMLSESKSQSRHAVMVDSMQGIVDRLPTERTGWATSLLQQTIVEYVQRVDAESRSLHLAATDLMGRLSISDRSDIRIASLDPNQPSRVVVRAQPLAVEASTDGDSWTKWPPEAESSDMGNPTVDSTGNGGIESNDAPSIYRSSAKDSTAVTLIPTDPASVTLKAFQAADPAPIATVEPTAHEMEAPLQTYNIRSVMYWLASTDAELRRQAELELMRRGLNTTQISLAKSLSLGDVNDRLETIERIVHDASIDPRPWLLWLMDDEHREVKLRVVNILATFSDPAVQQTLRERVTSETDPTVAARIRRVLDLR